ncbi:MULTISPECIES: dipeptidase [unclassified Rhodococcus (in: high G+C Gram-positive bacteria)]|uniref:dipeptidase n=1 Tax=unclassified Rhodococcus (in: high G+C Gram-positive bacteria) TaxID=192944 RepID=UPI0004858223|nr:MULTISPECIES: membrane dipeptidase [unclassified Rhodococcus (in: high G+C Gram-positive bacteria)]KQU36208.1 membrane dipeptidase [Rhodococcus sp. Leaf225]KQU48756.1 membrane dipeptidase [Rhodococcus sp. Leaf258]MBY6684862.1 membrane dipeptidase [Rhodococcus sp. BP-288]MBY6692654.1 membrane dipeptidase [Rhodococcus sp. BP-188]MBY6698552.1 membrane dipeptidase [Rhodococcus sp. BP-285]
MTALWEQHTCLPLYADTDITELARYEAGSYLSVNVGYSPHTKASATELATTWSARALADGRFLPARSVADIDEARRRGLRALAFDLEDSAPLDGDLDNVRYFVELGVRSMLPTYNHANAAGCGCLDAVDTGLTAHGRDLIRAMNEAGMAADGSHCSRRTGLDIAATTSRPMIYSHSNFAALWEHPRNITDEQARACADTGGVVGINGVGIFLGVNEPERRADRVRAMADHVEYGVDLVGIDHIGVGSDYSFDHEDFNTELALHPEAFSEEYTRYGALQWVPPEDTHTLPAVLAERGWDESAVAAVFGGNFRRVADAVWT